MSTNWELLVHYINSHHNGSTITRKNMMSYCNSASVDTYRRTLSRIGFMDDSKGGGEYVKRLSIPNDLSATKAQHIIRNDSYILKYWRSLKIKEIFLD